MGAVQADSVSDNLAAGQRHHQTHPSVHDCRWLAADGVVGEQATASEECEVCLALCTCVSWSVLLTVSDGRIAVSREQVEPIDALSAPAYDRVESAPLK